MASELGWCHWSCGHHYYNDTLHVFVSTISLSPTFNNNRAKNSKTKPFVLFWHQLNVVQMTKNCLTTAAYTILVICKMVGLFFFILAFKVSLSLSLVWRARCPAQLMCTSTIPFSGSIKDRASTLGLGNSQLISLLQPGPKWLLSSELKMSEFTDPYCHLSYPSGFLSPSPCHFGYQPENRCMVKSRTK